MNYPTGMGAGTGLHYHNVAAQMQAYLNQPAHKNYHHHQGQSPGHGFNPHHIQFGGHRVAINPMIANDVGYFARHFMRNILS